MRKTMWANVFLLLLWVLMTSTIAVERIIWGLFVVAGLRMLYVHGLYKNAQRSMWSWKSIVSVLKYIGLLIKEIWCANIQVAKMVLSPVIQLDSGYFTYKTKLKTDIGKVIFANSITLTPGTISVDVQGDELIIHYLASHIIDGFEDSDMEKILLEWEASRCIS